jgi:oligopeptide transport system substrate-binding protein
LTEPTDLDPHIITSQQDYNLMMAFFEGLLSQDPKDLHPVPGVAERWDVSDDGKVYTFHLRKDARWSNGDPVTAQDFLYSFRRILSPGLGSEYSYMHHVVQNAEAYTKGEITDFSQVGYKVIDDHTLQVTLNASTPYFLGLVAHNSWFPVHRPTIEKFGRIDQRGTQWTRPGNLVGNGPFRLKDWRMHQVVVAEKSPTYWDADKVRLQAIHFYPIESVDTEERAFRAGQLHVTSTIPQAKIDTYRAQEPEFLHVEPFLGTYFYRLNVTKPPFNNLKVRRALALAIDRESIVKNVMRGGQLAAYNLTPPDTAGYTSRARQPTDVEEARKLLAEAGYPNGAGFPKLELLFNTNEGHKQIAEAIQQMWKRNLNIDVTLLNQEAKVYTDTMRRLDYQIARYAWVGDYLDPNTFLGMMVTDSGNNQTGWSNPEYDRLIEEAARTADLEKRKEIFQKAEAILMAEAPVIPIYFYTRCNLRRQNVKGWYSNLLDVHPYKGVYLEAAR